MSTPNWQFWGVARVDRAEQAERRLLGRWAPPGQSSPHHHSHACCCRCGCTGRVRHRAGCPMATTIAAGGGGGVRVGQELVHARGTEDCQRTR